MVTIRDLTLQVIESKNPKIRRIYVSDDEFDALLEEAKAKDPWGGRTQRIVCAYAPVYRLREWPLHQRLSEWAKNNDASAH
jgi:hypothetical protein